MDTKITEKVLKLREKYSDEVLCKKIGITRPTLYKRIVNHNWKVSECFLIKNID